MQKGNNVTVGLAEFLQPGDLMAFDLADVVCSGKVTSLGIPGTKLETAQLEVLPDYVLTTRTSEGWFLNTQPKYVLLFGDFRAPGVDYKYLFLNRDQVVAVFPPMAIPT